MAMRWHLKELIGRAESITGERLPYRTISANTGISTNTIAAIASGRAKRADLRTIDMLLKYLGDKIGERLTTDDLLKHVEP